MVLVDERTWQISESVFFPAQMHHTETIYTVGNGYMGVRATFEEGYPGELASTLVHGLFDHTGGYLVPELVNLPNPLPIIIEVDGEPFTMEPNSLWPVIGVLGYKRTLRLKDATLERSLVWRNSAGTIVQITFERFASLDMEHLLAQRVKITALNRSCTVKVSASLDGSQTNDGRNHWASLNIGISGEDRLHAFGITGQSGYQVAMLSGLFADSTVSADLSSQTLMPAISTTFTLDKEESATLYKYTAIYTSHDTPDPQAAAAQVLEIAQSEGWDTLKARHSQRWAAYWHDSDIVIEGDEIAQRAIRFTTYHLLIAAPSHDEHVSIGAKTLSGPGYHGHVFWDTELFMLPMLTVTQPSLARNLLMYRYHNLPGARHKAEKEGYEGAMFPWESTDTGEETTPTWTNPDVEGNRIRIWTGEIEQHISTDIAYAVMEYWRWTADQEFFINYGAEIVLDTAVFWGSRAEYNQEKDRYELSDQIGPDEYHEHINNSAFTNSMVRWHLRAALQVYDWLKQNHLLQAQSLFDRLGIDAKRLALWQAIIDKMYIPYDQQRGIYEQFDGFFALEPIDLRLWQPRIVNMDAIIGHEPTQDVMVIKQADIVMLMALLGDEAGNLDERQRNWEFYTKVVDHGSSLSPSTHAWVAARLGRIEEAYAMFLRAANIDLGNTSGNVRDGIHAAAAGGVWQAVIWGFGGLHLDGDGFKLDPQLPDHWTALTFRIYHHGKQHTIRITKS